MKRLLLMMVDNKSFEWYFSNIGDTLNIPQTNHCDLNFENAKDSTLIAILKYCNDTSILVIKEKTKSGSVVAFNHSTRRCHRRDKRFKCL